jgi:hypothetical protein
VREFEDTVLLGAALQAAAINCGVGARPQDVIEATWALYEPIAHPTVNLAVTMTVSREQKDGPAKVWQTYQFESAPEETVMTQMTVDDTADIAVSETDDRGNPTSDALSWSGSDGGSVLTLTPSDDTKSCHVVPAAEGSADVTCSDPAAPQLAPYVVHFDVGAGPTAAIDGTVTVNTGGNPPA